MQHQVDQSLLPWSRVLAFGAGHFMNDMCAAMWFSYLLVYAKLVQGFSSTLAGTLILVGQLTDALCTPLVGFLLDKKTTRGLCSAYGHKKTWHLIGLVCVAFSFPFIFIKCFPCVAETPKWLQLFYYVPFVFVFQCGWACVQISHLALIPILAVMDHDRSKLSAIRNAAAVLANVVVFVMVYIFLGVVATNNEASVTPEDGPGITCTALIVTGVGLVFSLIFHVGTRENGELFKNIHRRNALAENESKDKKKTGILKYPDQTIKKWSDWFKFGEFYAIGILYMAVRLYANLVQAYLPFYITCSQNLDKKYIAIVPLIIFLSSFATSAVLSLKIISVYVDKKIIVVVASFISLAASFWMKFENLYGQLFGIAILLGASVASLLITAFGLIAQFIDGDTANGGVVYGAMSFADKISTGIAIQLIQKFHPDDGSSKQSLDDFYRNLMVYGVCCPIILCLIMVLVLWRRNIGFRTPHREKKADENKNDHWNVCFKESQPEIYKF